MSRGVRKILCILPLLFLLTGCDYTYNTTYLVGGLYNAIASFGIGIVEMMNSLNSALVNALLDVAKSGNGTGLETLASFGPLVSLVSLVSTLALVAIIIQFAKSIYRNYFASTDGNYAPTTIELIKKVFTASLAAYLIPYICITGFLTTTYAGIALPDILITEGELDKTLYDTYTTMSSSGISFSTYCEVGQKDAGVSNVSKLKGSDGKTQSSYEILIEDNSYTNIKVPIKGMSAYEFYCGYAGEKTASLKELEASSGGEINPKNVYESFAGSATLAKIMPVGSPNAFLGVSGPLALVLGIIEIVAIGIAWLVILLAVTRRVIDLVVLIGMSWWYIGASVSDSSRQSSLGELFKKLLSICLTQFIMSIEIYLFATTMTNFASVGGLISIIVWIGVLTSTPTVVEEMVSSTGAADTAANAGKGAWALGKGIFLGR